MSDDEYSLRRLNLSPVFWVRRFWQRRWVIRALYESSFIYVISEIQQKCCKIDLSLDCKILTKSYNFDFCPSTKVGFHSVPLKLLYAGNLGTGRLESLEFIIDALSQINQNGIIATLSIFSSTFISKRKKKWFAFWPWCSFHSAIPNEELKSLQEEADIVIHVESLKKRDALLVQQSFSTKLVDFFYAAKCIFAIGRKDEASIAHLLQHDAAAVVEHPDECVNVLRRLLLNPKLREYYSQKAFECGKKYHNRKEMQQMLLSDLKSLS